MEDENQPLLITGRLSDYEPRPGVTITMPFKQGLSAFELDASQEELLEAARQAVILGFQQAEEMKRLKRDSLSAFEKRINARWPPEKYAWRIYPNAREEPHRLIVLAIHEKHPKVRTDIPFQHFTFYEGKTLAQIAQQLEAEDGK